MQPARSSLDTASGISEAAELIHLLRTTGGLDRYYASAERLNPADASETDALDEAGVSAQGMSVIEYAQALDYEAHIIEQYFDKRGVELATIHGAKGREWPNVIVAGFQRDELPHGRSLANTDDTAGELEAERRLAYVAITRATESLVLMYDRDDPSQFLLEAAPVADQVDLGASSSSDIADGGSSRPTPPVAVEIPDENGHVWCRSGGPVCQHLLSGPTVVRPPRCLASGPRAT